MTFNFSDLNLEERNKNEAKTKLKEIYREQYNIELSDDEIVVLEE